MGFDKTLLADHRDGAAKLETVSKATSVDGNARVWALIMAKCCGLRLQGDRYDEEDIRDTYTRKVIQEYETEHLQATFYSSF